MKRILSLILVIFGMFVLIGCDIERREPPTNGGGNGNGTEIVDGKYDLNFYYLNDTHGAIMEGAYEIGFAKLGNLIIDEFKNKPEETVFITGGDMFQGQLISNLNRGELMVNLLNEMQLDAFVIGNHEFDWGIDVILDFANGTNANNVKANFPILGANIHKKGSTDLLEGIEPYTIIERNGLEIGIIGVIGDTLESSIAHRRINEYEFSNGQAAINKYYLELTNEKEVDMVVVVNHGDDYYFNNFAASLGANAIFNGHTHQVNEGFANGSTPFMQAGSNGYQLGLMSFKYQVTNGLHSNVDHVQNTFLRQANDQRLQVEHPLLAELIEAEIDLRGRERFEDVVITTGEYMNRTQLSEFITRAIVAYTGADIAFHNSGGTRTEFDRFQELRESDIFQVFPFDNDIVLVKVKGSTLSSYGTRNPHYSTITNIEADKTYIVALNDYMYFGNEYLLSSDYEIFELNLFEVFAETLKTFKEEGKTSFYLSDPINVGEN